MKESARHKFVSLAVYMACIRLGNLLPRNTGSSEISVLYLGPIHTSCCCRAKPIIIRCGTSTAFFMFDSYVEPNLSNLITNQAKIAFFCGKMTGALNEELLETSQNGLEIYQD